MITRNNYEIWFLDYAEGKLDSAQQKMLFDFLEKNTDLKKEFEAFENISFEAPLAKNTDNNNLKKKQSWLLEKYSLDELVFNYTEGNLNVEELREWNDLVITMPSLLQRVEVESKITVKPVATETFDEKILMRKEPVAYAINKENHNDYFILYTETKSLALHSAINTFLKSNPSLQAEFELTQKLILKPDTSVVFENKEQLKQREKVVAFYLWRSIVAAACIILAVIFFYPSNDGNVKSLAGIKDSTKAVKQNQEKKNELSPNNNVEKENNSNNVNNVALNRNIIRKKKSNIKNQKEEISNQKIVPDLIENKKDDKNFVEVPKNNNKKDTLKPNIPEVNEKPENNLANNQANKKSENGNQKSENGLRPLNAVASVINNKYYDETTPKDETTSPFYAMKNVVKSASGGNADINKKEDGDYKEMGFKIGEFKFSRKKNKNKEKID